MQDRIRHFLHHASTLPIIRPLMSRYFRGRYNIVFSHFIGRVTPPHYNSFSPSGTDPDSFRRDLEQLSRQFEFVSLDEVLCGQSRNPGHGRKPCMALTIDDGMDFLDDTVLSIFDDYGIRPCCFIITKYIGNGDLMWRHKLSAIIHMTPPGRLAEAIGQTWPVDSVEIPLPDDAAGLLRASSLFPYGMTDSYAQQLWDSCGLPPVSDYMKEYRPYLTWKRIAGLKEAGFCFGSHSHTHPAFDKLSRAEALHEMRDSLKVLEQHLGPGDYAFAYPFGRLPPRETRSGIEQQGGYSAYLGTYGFSSTRGKERRFLQRICIEGGISSVGLAPAYPAAAMSQRLTRHHNPRV